MEMQSSGPARAAAAELLRRSAAVGTALMLILVILPTLVRAAA